MCVYYLVTDYSVATCPDLLDLSNMEPLAATLNGDAYLTRRRHSLRLQILSAAIRVCEYTIVSLIKE